MRYFVSLFLFTSCFAAFAEDAGPLVFFDDGDNTGYLQSYASTELRQYFPKMFTNPVAADKTTPAEFTISLGTPENNPSIAEGVTAGTFALPQGPLAEQGYTLKNAGNRVYVAALTEQGVLYGIYAFLEAYGAYFQISGERLPSPAPFAVKALDQVSKPAFKYRGLLPWDNFLCGISGYNPEDYQLLIDRAARMKLNFLQFHFYPGIAFFTETVDGVRVNPSCIGMPVDVFPTAGTVGEAAFGGEAVFGSRPYVENIGNPQAQADAVQEMMRKVLDHAHARGMQTCVGFELMQPSGGSPQWTDKPDGGANCLDPLRPENLAISLQRYKSLVQTYPQSDYYWFWQSEGRGVLGLPVGREPGAAQMRTEYARWTPLQAYQGDIEYAYHFKDVINQLTPEEQNRIATGGWFIQHLFPGIHPDIAPGVRFASLNSYAPDQTVDNHMWYYQVAQQGRPIWMIDWWEFDGEQWFPQWRVTWQEKMYRQCLAFGVESITLLGWKLSGVEHNIRYLSEFSWNPDLTAAEFYGNYARRLYGQDGAPLAELYLAYDLKANKTPPATPFDDRPMLLGAGWMDLGIPAYPRTPEELGSDTWRNTVNRAAAIVLEQKAFLEADRNAVALIGQTIPGLDEQGQSWAALMLNRLRMRSLYLESMIALNESFGIFQEQAAADMGQAKQAAVTRLNDAVRLAREAIELYSKDIRNRGDLGVLAQMNVQYLQSLTRFLAVASE